MYDSLTPAQNDPNSMTDRGEPVVRPYREADRASVRKLCCDSAYLGQPIDAAFSDRSLFAAIFIDPYLDCYPGWTFILEHHGTVIGYLTAAIGIRHFLQQIHVGFIAFGRLLAGSILRGRTMSIHDRMFLHWLLLCSWRERVRRPPIMAHMHFCIHMDYRGRFLAHRLWTAFEHKLEANGIAHYYGEVTTCRPRQTVRVYGRYGLQLYDQARSSMFAHIDDQPIWTVCIRK